MASLETGKPLVASTKFEGSPFRLYLTTSCACLCTLAFGFCVGYSSNAIPSLEKEGILTKESSSWFGSLLTVGAMLGGPIGGFFIENVGRKRTILFTNLTFLLSSLLLYFSFGNIKGLYFGRFLSGLGSGASCVCVPVYIAETSTKKLRGLLGSCTQLSITLGITFAYAFGVNMNWNQLAGAGGIVPAIAIVTLVFLPETPRYLIGKKKKQGALQALASLRGPHVDVQEEYHDIEEGIDFQEDFSWSEFKKPELMRPLFVSLSLVVMQQMSGINAVMFYTTQIFKSAGFERGAEAGVIVGVVQVLATMVSCVLMDRAGRRKLLVIAGAVMAVSCTCFGFYYYLKSTNGPFAVLSMVVYIIGFSLGWGPIPMLIMSEIFPARARGPACGIAIFMNWFAAFIVTQEFLQMQTFLGGNGGGIFWFFGFCCLGSVMFVEKYVPETKGKSLEDIELYFLGRATTY